MNDEPATDEPPDERPVAKIEINQNPKANFKPFAGGDRDEWNNRLTNIVVFALPINQGNVEMVEKKGGNRCRFWAG